METHSPDAIECLQLMNKLPMEERRLGVYMLERASDAKPQQRRLFFNWLSANSSATRNAIRQRIALMFR